MKRRLTLALLAVGMMTNAAAQTAKTYKIFGANIRASEYMQGIPDTTGTYAKYEIEPRADVPFTQYPCPPQSPHECPPQSPLQGEAKTLNSRLSSRVSPLKGESEGAVRAERAEGAPYYNVRCAIPIPSCYTPTEQGQKVGLDWGVYTHNHSAGFEVCPNGDVLAVYFSTPVGKAEADTCTTFVQCRRRYGSDEWDMPELLFKTKGGNDQSALLFTDKDTLWLFAGGRDMTDGVPFRILKSTDNGASWTYIVPQLDKPMQRYTAQPISNAFRNKQGELFVAIDGNGAESLLLRSRDGIHWHDMGGRTSSRHSTIVMLDDNGTLLSAAGKNNFKDGWNPMNISTDWGATWSEPMASPFPPNGTAQRPCIIRLKSGALCIVGDSYMHKKKIAPPNGWKNGNECYVAISRDNGKTWKFKTLPITLPQHHRIQYPSLGYVTMRQGQDGLIHVLTTTNYPGLEIDFNEAWIDADDIVTAKDAPNSVYGNAEAMTPLAKSGYYCLNGTFSEKYPNGNILHVVTYKDGRRTGIETYYREDGTKVWEWNRDLKTNTARWSHYRKDGKVRMISRWNIQPEPRDLPGIKLNGAVADMYTWEYDKVGMQTENTRFNNGIMEGSEKNFNSAIIVNEGK